MAPEIVLKKAGDLFLCHASSPTPGVNWELKEPMHRSEVVQELLQLGFHAIDIGDALFLADPTYLAADPTALRHEHLRRTRQQP